MVMSPSGIADSADPTNLQMIAICCALAFGLTVIIATMMPAAQLARNMADFRKSVIGRRTDQTPGEKRPSFPLRIGLGVLRLAAFAFGLGIALPALAQAINGSSLTITGQSNLQGAVTICSGDPWVDVRCNGATGDGNHDDTTAINTTISAAITNNWPVYLSAGTYKVTSPNYR
jgi:Pectate lyase superfamily protein